MDLIVRQARVRAHDGLFDVAMQDGRVAAVEPRVAASATEELDANGRLLAPAMANAHIHLCKAFTRPWIEGATTGLDTYDVIAAAAKIKERYTEDDVAARAVEGLRLALRYGTTQVRAFADVDSFARLTAVRGLLEAKRRFTDLMDIQVVAFPQQGLLRDPGTEELLRQAMEAGADVVGGIPWLEWDDALVREHVQRVFAIAREFDAPIHMLVDETDDPTARSLEVFAAHTLAAAYGTRAAASHAAALSAYDETHARKVIDLVRTANMHIVTNPHPNLMLLGRVGPDATRRTTTRIRSLWAAGVNVALGQDDLYDAYYPFGRMDMLEVAWLAAHVGQFARTSELEAVYNMISANGSRVMGLQPPEVRPGAPADFVLFDAASIPEVLRLHAEVLAVIRRGRVVVRNETRTRFTVEVPGLSEQQLQPSC